MKILDRAGRKISWSYHAIGLTIHETRKRHADGRDFSLARTKLLYHLGELRDSGFGCDVADSAREYSSFIVNQSRPRLCARDVDSDEVCS